MRISAFRVFVAILLLAVAAVTVRAWGQNAPAMPAVGQLAPTFTLPSQDGTPISLASFRGKWVVLYFYPKDMSMGCTIEAHNFQRDLGRFQSANAVILGVSVDSANSHQEFCTKEALYFRLLSDPQHSVVEAYGSLGNYAGFKVAKRNTFLIDPKGKVAKVWTKVDVQQHSLEVMAALAELQKAEAKK